MTATRPNDREEVYDPLLVGEGSTSGESDRTKCVTVVRKKRSDGNPTDNHQYSFSFIRKKRLIIFVVIVVFLIYIKSAVISWENYTTERIPVFHHSHVPGMKGYLVWSDKCKMLNMDPYASDVMKYFHREKYEPCAKEQPLTSIKYSSKNKTYILHLEESLKDQYTKSRGQLECCYQEIERSGKGKKADKEYKLSECLSFTKSITVPQATENILVKCKSQKQQTYINAHAMIQEKPQIRERIENWRKMDKGSKQPISILMLGIDSISRQNLIRAMPKTAQYLYDTEWFEMSGYNKIDDNTFPNLVAILVGYNLTTAFHKCDPTKVGALDKCPFIWYDFRKYGYVTAYGEDEASINTFNYIKKGFQKPPVDYYMRPFLLAAEAHLPVKRKSSLSFCLGYKHSAEYIYDYALEFSSNYKSDPFFGLFWTNTFSHNAISDASSMDDKIVEYLHQFSDRGVLNKSVVIFFSDHGIRFGPTRKLLSGHLEERLPFFFMWLPPSVKNAHPEFVDALNVNKNRLTNPYDVHMTLKHILELSGRVKNLPQAEDCPNCQTLLRPVPHSRSCEDIAIEDHWCTCYPYVSMSTSLPLVYNITIFTVDYINNYVSTYKNGSISHFCAKLSLHQIKNAYKAMMLNNDKNSTNSDIQSYRVVFETNPGLGLFEASIRHFVTNNEFEITGSISRLNSYSKDSACVGDGGAKKYCFCTKSGRSHG